MTRQFAKFSAYLEVVDRMIHEASKDRVAETAQVLALELAHYRTIFGEIPASKVFELLAAETITNAQAEEMAHGCEVLIRTMNALNKPANSLH